jgi:hypothetical protein
MKYTLFAIFLVVSFSVYSQEATSSKRIVSNKQTTETIEKATVNENSELATSNKKIPTTLPLIDNQKINSDTVSTSGHIENSSKRIPKDEHN